MSTRVTAAELARDAQDFLRFKRAMGLSYRRAEFVLDGFVRFVAGQAYRLVPAAARSRRP